MIDTQLTTWEKIQKINKYKEREQKNGKKKKDFFTKEEFDEIIEKKENGPEDKKREAIKKIKWIDDFYVSVSGNYDILVKELGNTKETNNLLICLKKIDLIKKNIKSNWIQESRNLYYSFYNKIKNKIDMGIQVEKSEKEAREEIYKESGVPNFNFNNYSEYLKEATSRWTNGTIFDEKMKKRIDIILKNNNNIEEEIDKVFLEFEQEVVNEIEKNEKTLSPAALQVKKIMEEMLSVDAIPIIMSNRNDIGNKWQQENSIRWNISKMDVDEIEKTKDQIVNDYDDEWNKYKEDLEEIQEDFNKKYNKFFICFSLNHKGKILINLISLYSICLYNEKEMCRNSWCKIPLWEKFDLRSFKQFVNGKSDVIKFPYYTKTLDGDFLPEFKKVRELSRQWFNDNFSKSFKVEAYSPAPYKKKKEILDIKVKNRSNCKYSFNTEKYKNSTVESHHLFMMSSWKKLINKKYTSKMDITTKRRLDRLINNPTNIADLPKEFHRDWHNGMEFDFKEFVEQFKIEQSTEINGVIVDGIQNYINWLKEVKNHLPLHEIKRYFCNNDFNKYFWEKEIKGKI
ncbi:MAG: hypothetical protein ACRC4M_03255 [Mycoplasma sp.]